MFNALPAISAGSLRLARFIGVLSVAAFAGCATHYLDGGTREVAAATFRKPVEPMPVQLLFEFQTKGTLNSRATELLKAQVTEQVKSSGLFSGIDDKPVTGGGLLSVTLNNVPLTDDVFSKGFVTGATFGLVGSQVSDGYVCTVKFQSSARPATITKMARHAIHTAMGANSAPPNSKKMENLSVAVTTMTREIVSTTLNDLSQDPSFK